MQNSEETQEITENLLYVELEKVVFRHFHASVKTFSMRKDKVTEMTVCVKNAEHDNPQWMNVDEKAQAATTVLVVNSQNKCQKCHH